MPRRYGAGSGSDRFNKLPVATAPGAAPSVGLTYRMAKDITENVRRYRAFCLALDRRDNVHHMRSRRSASRRKITPEMVIAGYQQGYFPMAMGRFGHINWFLAEPRTVIPLDDRFHVRRSLRKVLKKSKYQLKFNTDFSAVIHAC